MEQTNFVLEVVLVIGAATVGAAIFERIKLPAIAGFLVMGALVGPGGLRLVSEPERVTALAELGVALLLFEIGLELPLGVLRREWRTVAASGALQVGFTVAMVSATAMAFGVAFETALVVGMLVSMSSTAFVMRVLAQRDEINAAHGQLSVGMLLFQDLCLVPFLLAVPILSGEIPYEPRPLALAIGRAVAALALLLATAQFVLPWVLERIARLRSPDLFSLFAFLMAIGSAVAAEELGLTLAVGAFVAGLVVNASPYNPQLFAEVVPLRGVLLGIFFTAVGMLFDPFDARESWIGILLFVGAVVIVKTGIIALVVGWFLGRGPRVGILTGLGLAQTGEFSFVLAEAAAPSGLLSESLRQTFVAGSVLTLLATPFLVRVAPKLAERFTSEVDRARTPSGAAAEGEFIGHVVIIGFGRAGQTLARVLEASGIAFRIVDQNPEVAVAAQEQGLPAIYGDATRAAILARVGVPRARIVTVAISDRAATRRCIAVVRALAPEVPIVVRTRNMNEVDGLLAAGATEVVAEEFESAIDIFSKVLLRFGTPQPAIARFAEAMRMEGYEFMRVSQNLPIDPWLAELLEQVSSEWIEVPDGDWGERRIVDLAIRARTGANIVAVVRNDVTTSNPGPEFAIRPRDSLLVLASTPNLRKLRDILDAIE